MDIVLGQQYIYNSSSSSEKTSYSNNNSPKADEEEAITTLASSKPKKRAGRRIFKETRHPVYRGVRRRNNNRWVCEVRVPNSKSSRIWLGTYATPEMAARAHDVAALVLRGKSACLNFADSAWRLPLPASSGEADIRKAAASAAKAFGVEESGASSSSSGVSECEGCSRENVAMENELKGLCLDVEFDDDWIRRMAEEPLRSPLPLMRYYYGIERDQWNDIVEVDDAAQVPLWNFTI